MSMVMLTADLALSFGIDLLPAAAIAPRAKPAGALRPAHRVNEFRERCTRAVVKVPAAGRAPDVKPSSVMLGYGIAMRRGAELGWYSEKPYARQCIPASGARAALANTF